MGIWQKYTEGYEKHKVIVWIVVLLFLFGGCWNLFSTEEKPTVEYKLVEEEDISYAGCKRVGIRIVVPDNSDKEHIENTLEKIIHEKKGEWDDITVWAWKYSEEGDVGKILATMGMKEWSRCE